MAAKLRRRNSRGFVEYGTVICTYGSEVRIAESSACAPPHCWIFQKQKFDPRSLRDDRYSGGSHLSVAQTRKVIALLQAFVDDHPSGRRR
jgi:hypothetical protein